MSFFDDLIESKALTLHTCFLGKILSVSGGSATVQPLNMVKQVGKDAKPHAPIPNVPISTHCKGKIVEKTLKYVSGVSNHSATYSTTKYLQFEALAKGDVVICVCGERDITEAKRGKLSIPSNRHHSLSDALIIGVL